MTKNPAEIAGTRYKNEKLMSRMQNTDGTSRCFAQSENIKRQSLVTPSIKFNLFYILLHIYRHFLYEGVGLRQLIDYYFVLKAANGEFRKETNAVLSQFGMARFAKGVMWIMKNVLLLDDSYLLCNPDAKEGEYIFRQIILGGNFGHHDKRLSNTPSGKFGTVCRIIKHNFHLLTHYPSDVIWAPIWFIYHWFWKRFYMLKNRALLKN